MDIVFTNTKNGKTSSWNPETKGLIWGETSYSIYIVQEVERLAEDRVRVVMAVGADDVPIDLTQDQIEKILSNIKREGDSDRSLAIALRKIRAR